jgi:hypothetical protein
LEKGIRGLVIGMGGGREWGEKRGEERWKEGEG